MYFDLKELNNIASQKRINDRQTGVAMPTVWGNGNGDPDMRKLYCPELSSSTMTTDGPNGLRCGYLTTIIGNGAAMPGDPVIKNHTSTSDYGGTYTIMPGGGNPHTEAEMIETCARLLPPEGAEFPWVYYHVTGDGLDPGYYYFLDATDGPHPGKGPGWPT